ncbi:hypothetical protein Lal_00012127 [Lupinus albus]|uniref:Uncharacterized protein n=1 Tax=Lupinus albus TaxID=3870 RepID=A0A6A4QJX3_LUPAL|nr:hypothetical protein Lalb_Chr05g0228811 [Lupinus albus]KAF1871910.1 hypothetical protein Lal_00012127 [Lupinus albus]
MDSHSFKLLKEQFVSNLNGSSMLELFALTTSIPILILIRHSITSNLLIGAYLKKKKNDDAVSGTRNFKAYLATLSLDYLVIVVPMLLFFTVLADWSYIVSCLLIILTLLYIATKRSCDSSLSFEGEPNSLRSYIMSYRVIVMVITFLCILAVDFKIFPRRYAKTETYGTSLMDLGVGAYVLANSLVSRQARNITSVNLKNAIVSSSPLIILGFLRLVTTTGVDYQVHVGEYGVHWNFFFTLGAVSILTSIINIPPRYSGICGLLVLVGYQFCLMNGLNHYLLSNERGMDIISQNKEGIFSIFGYWGLYLLGVHLGNYLIFGSHTSGFRSNRWVRLRVWVLCILFWLLTVLLDRHVERISRRTCNLPYVTLVVADNLQLISILMLADLVPGRKTSILEEAYNRNLLATFLLANILTGLVNLSIDTLSVSSFTALCIMLIYSYILSTVIGFADYLGMKLKFW